MSSHGGAGTGISPSKMRWIKITDPIKALSSNFFTRYPISNENQSGHSRTGQNGPSRGAAFTGGTSQSDTSGLLVSRVPSALPYLREHHSLRKFNILEHIPSPICIVDFNGIVVYGNHRFKHFIAIPTGKPFADALVTEDKSFLTDALANVGIKHKSVSRTLEHCITFVLTERSRGTTRHEVAYNWILSEADEDGMIMICGT